jgi:hypothetical protein
MGFRSDNEQGDTMKLREVEIENFKGIQSANFTVGDGGSLFVGKSKSGKTSMADAVHAALKSKGFGPECICDDADRWRVLLKFDTATVQTIVRRSGTKDVKVDGLGLGSPQAKLDAIFPDLIDPWKLAQDEPAARRRKVLAAMPATATAADMKLWTGDDWTPADGKHGLEVVKDARDHYYALRTQANKAAELAEQAHRQANAEAERLVALDTLEKGAMVPLPGEEDAPVRAAEAARKQLDQRKADAEAMAIRTRGTRIRIDELRAEADDEDASGHAPMSAAHIEGIKATLVDAMKLVAKLQAKLADAKRAENLAEEALATAEHTNRKHAESDAKAMALRGQAADLESTLAEAAIVAPEPEEFDAADLAIAAANLNAAKIRAARKAHDAIVDAADKGDEATAAKAEAKRLDDIVKRLDNDAPAELAKRANLIPGLTFIDDDLALDGKVFKVLCGSEKTELCVDLVKRIAPEAKLLRIDRLEGMDPDMREGFIKHAKTGGWQILGTVVERGEMKIVTIDADGEQADAPVTEIKTAKGKRVKVIMPEGEGK